MLADSIKSLLTILTIDRNILLTEFSIDDGGKYCFFLNTSHSLLILN